MKMENIDCFSYFVNVSLLFINLISGFCFSNFTAEVYLVYFYVFIIIILLLDFYKFYLIF